MIDISFMSEQ